MKRSSFFLLRFGASAVLGAGLCFFSLSSTTHASNSAASSGLISLSASVEKICVECDMVDLTNGGSLNWDVVTVRVTTPQDLFGTKISVRVLVEGDGSAQRKTYPLAAHISFHATKAAIDAREVRLHLSDIKAIQTEPENGPPFHRTKGQRK